MMVIRSIFIFALMTAPLAHGDDALPKKPIRVLVWDEQQPAQAKAYDG